MFSLSIRRWSQGAVAVVFLATQISTARANDSTEAAPVATLPTLVVVGRSESLLGTADSAAQGDVGQAQLAERPLLRTGEVLETVPGLITTQHSGTGKANQYFLRGFNLDHGTDFAVSVDGVPMNLPTHAHGQGYLDMNFLMPELVDHIEYKKGPYYAEVGDFSSAGAADIHYVDQLPSGIVKVGGGSYQYGRGFVADSLTLGAGHLLFGFDSQYDNGPWDAPERYKKFSGLVKFTEGDKAHGVSLALNGYSGEWNSTDQIPRRAVDEGLLGRFGTLSPTDGGASGRAGLTANYWDDAGAQKTLATAYVHYYRLNLWSDFTFFLDNPVNGDQFEQIDRRIVSGGSASRTWSTDAVGLGMDNTVGVQVRDDAIPEVGIHHTEDRNDLGTIRQDAVRETSGGVYVRNEIHWAEKFRSIAGLREDGYDFNVNSDIAANSGHVRDHIVSPKLALIFGPWADTEYYLNGGAGFHSNDARGTTITRDPNDGTPAEKVSPLVRSKGAEVGVRTNIVPDLRSTLAFWILDLDSELLFTGDAGTTEPSRPSRRNGVEWTNFYKPLSWLEFDGDLALTHAEFMNSGAVRNEIPGSIGRVVSAGATVNFPAGVFGSFRVRHFGDLPLMEDNSVRAAQSTICNLEAGLHAGKRITFTFDVLNIFNTQTSDINYFYTSRLQGEPAEGVNDVHFHPGEPREFRAYTVIKF